MARQDGKTETWWWAEGGAFAGCKVLEMLEGPRKETFPPGLRARGKAWGGEVWGLSVTVMALKIWSWRHSME